MPVKSEGNRLGDWLKEEFEPEFCREEGTILSGQNLISGTPLGKVTASGKFVAYDNNASDGSQTAVGVLIRDVDATAGDMPGLYLARGPAVIAKPGLTWATANNAGDKTAGLADLAAINPAIIAREGV